MLQNDVIAKLIAMNTPAATRVHHEVVPQDLPLPFMATTEVFAQQPMALSGQKLLASSQIRVGIFAPTGAVIEQMKGQIRVAFHGFRGWLGSTNVATCRVESSTDQVSFANGDKVIKGAAIDLFFKFYQE